MLLGLEDPICMLVKYWCWLTASQVLEGLHLLHHLPFSLREQTHQDHAVRTIDE